MTTPQAEKLLAEIRDLCAAMLAETRAEAERQAEVRAQYASAVQGAQRFQRLAIALVALAAAAVVGYFVVFGR